MCQGHSFDHREANKRAIGNYVAQKMDSLDPDRPVTLFIEDGLRQKKILRNQETKILKQKAFCLQTSP